MATPYATLKSAIQHLEKACVKLDDTSYLVSDTQTTVRDKRLMFDLHTQIYQAVTDLKPVLWRLKRLSTPPAGEQGEA